MSYALLRQIPKVDLILANGQWQRLAQVHSEDLAKDALRQYLSDLRLAVREGRVSSIPAIEVIIEETRKKIIALTTPTLRRVMNGTGTIIHTNLGRSLLAGRAIQAIVNVAAHYSNLEYDLEKGERGDRYEHCSTMLQRLTGAESALVVNNNAAAVFLVLNTLAEGKEVIISRGELVEIGGSFRIPDVMKKSSAILREVGTTNRTYIDDYEHAITDNTGLIMKVHTSNYRIRGFTHEATVEELAALGEKYGVPTYYDAGSGLLCSLAATGITDEPLICQESAKGISAVSFSGDKLLGAPQSGIVIGDKCYIDTMKRNPLTRALRPDKFTLAALETTLILYLDTDRAKKEIPTLRMILEDKDALKRRAARIVKQLKGRCSGTVVSAIDTYAEIGGGSLPDVVVPSFGISLEPRFVSIDALEKRLRGLDTPIVGRIEKNKIILDMRTILREEDAELLHGLESALQDEG